MLLFAAFKLVAVKYEFDERFKVLFHEQYALITSGVSNMTPFADSTRCRCCTSSSQNFSAKIDYNADANQSNQASLEKSVYFGPKSIQTHIQFTQNVGEKSN